MRLGLNVGYVKQKPVPAGSPPPATGYILTRGGGHLLDRAGNKIIWR